MVVQLAGGTRRQLCETAVAGTAVVATVVAVEVPLAVVVMEAVGMAVAGVEAVAMEGAVMGAGTTVTVAGTGLLHAAAPAAEAGGGDYSSSVWAPSWRRDLQCRFGTSSYRAAFDPVAEKWFGCIPL